MQRTRIHSRLFD